LCGGCGDSGDLCGGCGDSGCVNLCGGCGDDENFVSDIYYFFFDFNCYFIFFDFNIMRYKLLQIKYGK
jgi:hypothetical protein